MLRWVCHEGVTTASPTLGTRSADRNGMEWAMSDVSAGPNRSRITGHLARVEPSMTSVGKWYLVVEVQEAEAIEGGRFARPGEVARLFTFGDQPPLDAGPVISAEVEYIGGPTAGEFRLIRLLDRPSDVGAPTASTGEAPDA
jgi:hypothetical protein